MVVDKLLRYLNRNKVSLSGNAIKKNEVNLEWWAGTVNLGDTLAVIIYEWMLKRKELSIDKKTKSTYHLMTVGSLISFKQFDAVLWGTGTLNAGRSKEITRQSKYRKYDIRAVRGPLTKELLEVNGYNVPDVFGDPGILLPLIYNPKKAEKKYEITAVLHYEQIGTKLPDECHFLDIRTDDYKNFVDELVASKKIVSSSLHGIILAEAYGVPAIFLCQGMYKQLFKFYDWYYSTGRYNVRVATSIEEALNMEPMPLPQLDEMRNELLESFPYDLYK